MAKTFKLELLAADRPFFVGECEHLIYPAQDGLVGVLPGHESLVTIVSPGEIQYKVDGEWRYAAISEGFAEIRSDYALILGDAIELPEEIDAKRAAEAATRAKERLRQRQSIMQYYQSQAALNRAMNRLKISRRHNNKFKTQTRKNIFVSPSEQPRCSFLLIKYVEKIDNLIFILYNKKQGG